MAKKHITDLLVTGTTLLFFVLMCSLLVSCTPEAVEQAAPVKPVKIVEVGKTTEGFLLAFPGKVEAAEKVDLSFRVPGQIETLLVNEGDRVQKGQVLARLDQNDYKAQLGTLTSQEQGARARKNEALANVKRSRTLLTQGAIAQAAFDEVQTQHESAVAALNSLTQQIRQAKLNLEYTELKAPYAGIISTRYIREFTTVQAQQAIVRLENISAIDVLVDIPERIWAIVQTRLKAGMTPEAMAQDDKIQATFSAYPGKNFSLRPKEFQTQANPETQTYRITFTMENSRQTTIFPGMTAEVSGTLPLDSDTAGIYLPSTAVVGGRENKSYVWLLDRDSMTVSRREVTLGGANADRFLVYSGIDAGDVVVAAGGNYLSEGQKVRILTGTIGES